MGLPKALLERLNKRGLIQDPNKKDEEVFAEEYDETVENTVKNTKSSIEIDHKNPDVIVKETANCPDVNNPYHKCTESCFDNFGYMKFKTEVKTTRLRDRMLKKYPLPANWIEVGDPITGRYYYWNLVNDDVCWLSPIHPRAQITRPSDVLKDLMIKSQMDKDERIPKNLDDEDDRIFNYDEDRRRGRRRRKSSSQESLSTNGSRASSRDRRRHRRRSGSSNDSGRSIRRERHRRYSRSRSNSRSRSASRERNR